MTIPVCWIYTAHQIGFGYILWSHCKYCYTNNTEYQEGLDQVTTCSLLQYLE